MSSSNSDELESENDTEIWALVNAVGTAKKPEEMKIRALTAIARLNGRIAGRKETKYTGVAEDYRSRAKRITAFAAVYRPSLVLGQSGFIITDEKAGVKVPASPRFLDVAQRAFNEAHTAYEVPALVRLLDEMLGFVEKEGIMDPSKKRNPDTFKQMLNRYSGSTGDYWTGTGEEFTQ